MLTTAKLPRKIKDLEDEVKDVSSTVSKIQSAVTSKNEDLEKKVNEQSTKLTTLQSDVNNQFKTTEDSISNLQSSVKSDLEGKADNKDLTDVRSTVNTLETSVENATNTLESNTSDIAQMKKDITAVQPVNAKLDLFGYDSVVDKEYNKINDTYLKDETITDETKMTNEQKERVKGFKKKKEVRTYTVSTTRPIQIEVNKNNVLDVIRMLLKNAHQHIVTTEVEYNCDCDCSYEIASEYNDKQVVKGWTENGITSIEDIDFNGMHIDGQTMKSDLVLSPDVKYDFSNVELTNQDTGITIIIDNADDIVMDKTIVLLDGSLCSEDNLVELSEFPLPDISYTIKMNNGITVQGKGYIDVDDKNVFARITTADKLSFHATAWNTDAPLLKLNNAR